MRETKGGNHREERIAILKFFVHYKYQSMKNHIYYLLLFSLVLTTCTGQENLNPDLTHGVTGEYRGRTIVEVISTGANGGTYEQDEMLEVRKVSDTEVDVYYFENFWRYHFTADLLRKEDGIGLMVRDMIHGSISLTGRTLSENDVHGMFTEDPKELIFRLEYKEEREDEPVVHMIFTFNGQITNEEP